MLISTQNLNANLQALSSDEDRIQASFIIAQVKFVFKVKGRRKSTYVLEGLKSELVMKGVHKK